MNEGDPLIFAATYSDWKVVKTRKVVQVVLEIALENAFTKPALEVLGGMPDPSHEVWVAVARMEKPLTGEQSQARERKRSFAQLPLPQQAALACKDPVFWAFCREARNEKQVINESAAADYVRTYCGVSSRSLIKAGEDSGHLWEVLRDAFQSWKFEDSVR